MLKEPVRRVFGQAQDPEVQLQIGRRRRCPLYRPLPCRVRVEEGVDPIRVATEHAQVAWGSRRSQRGDSVLNARLVEHQHVRVAFDNESRAFSANGFGDLREAVEQVPFVEDLRLRRVEVLGLGVAQRPCSEAHDPTPTVRDGEGDPTRETLPTPWRKEPGCIENVPVEIQPPSHRYKPRYTPWRSIPQTKFFYSRTLYVAVFQVAAGLICFWGFGLEQVLVIVDGGGGESFVDRTSTESAFPCCAWVSPALELQLYAGAVGEVGDRFGEV